MHLSQFDDIGHGNSQVLASGCCATWIMKRYQKRCAGSSRADLSEAKAMHTAAGALCSKAVFASINDIVKSYRIAIG
jgi:hypothetical protein